MQSNPSGLRKSAKTFKPLTSASFCLRSLAATFWSHLPAAAGVAFGTNTRILLSCRVRDKQVRTMPMPMSVLHNVQLQEKCFKPALGSLRTTDIAFKAS